MTPDPDDERDLQKDPPVGFMRRVAYLFGPVVLTALVAGVLYLLTDQRTLNQVLLAGGLSLLGAGTTVVFGKAAFGDDIFRFNLETWHLALIVMYVNAVSGFFYAYNLDLLQKVWKVGPYLRQARKNAVAMLRQRPWIRRWSTFGVGLFVITPLPGSGALGGPLIGRILGMSKRASFITVAVAGVIVSVCYALLARELEQALDQLERFTPAWVRLAVFACFALVMIWLMTKLVRWFASNPPEKSEDAAETETPVSS